MPPKQACCQGGPAATSTCPYCAQCAFKWLWQLGTLYPLLWQPGACYPSPPWNLTLFLHRYQQLFEAELRAAQELSTIGEDRDCWAPRLLCTPHVPSWLIALQGIMLGAALVACWQFAPHPAMQRRRRARSLGATTSCATPASSTTRRSRGGCACCASGG